MAAEYCCQMRAYFLIGIVATRTDVPQPVDIADYVMEWEPQIVIKIRHCPFCGEKIRDDETVRVLR